MSKSNFIIHESTIVQIDLLTDEELGRLLRAMTKYHLEGVEPSKDDRLLYSVFTEWKRRYDEDKAKYVAVCKRNQINGSKSSGAPKGNRNAKKVELSIFDDDEIEKQPKTTQNNPKQPKQPDNDNDTDNESTYVDNKKKIDKRKSEFDNSQGEREVAAKPNTPKKFVKPSIDELQAYITEKGYHFIAENFYNFYESKGWMIGKNHMKDWKAACRTWEAKRKQEGLPTSQESVDELPAGMTEASWAQSQKWMQNHLPRISSKITPKEFMTMKATARHKRNVFSAILEDIEKSDYEGSIPLQFGKIAEQEPYKSQILANG